MKNTAGKHIEIKGNKAKDPPHILNTRSAIENPIKFKNLFDGIRLTFSPFRYLSKLKNPVTWKKILHLIEERQYIIYVYC